MIESQIDLLQEPQGVPEIQGVCIRILPKIPFKEFHR